MRRSILFKSLLLTGAAVTAALTTGDRALACDPLVVVGGPGTSSDISNSGAIDCVVIKDQAVVNGDVANDSSGRIGGSGQEAGISVHDATISGAIVNRGVISTTGGPAISVTGKSSVTGGIRNEGESKVEGGESGGAAQGISVTGANMTGGITNTGTIIVISGKGRATGIGVGQPPQGNATRPQEPQQ